MSINRLVSVLVLQLFSNIRRQRHLTYLVKCGKEILLALKSCDTVSVLQHINYLRLQLTTAKNKSCADLGFFARSAKNLPDHVLFLLHKQKLNE